MARDRANINTDIWNDDDFRSLSAGAQLLYFQLLTSATLTYAGVADWRPNRLAALASGRSASEVRSAGEELSEGLYIVTDEDTEEVLIRSFMKHDGLLQKPNVAKAMVKAYDRVYSLTLKGVIVHELNRLHEQFPEWKAFEVEAVLDVMGNRSVNPSEGVTRRVRETLPERDAPLLTTNYLLPTTNYPLPASSELEAVFESAYSHWPKKTERAKSQKKFVQLAKKHGAEWLAEQVVRFGDAYSATTEKQFVPALVVWLNGERWTDELPEAQQRGVQQMSKAAQNAQRFREEFGDGYTGSVPALNPGVGL